MPATVEAARACDAYGCIPGNAAEQCDTEQAYTQAACVGTPTWVRLPRGQWPPQWEHMTDPVCLLILALYGHPDSGGHWEAHCEKQLTEAGFIHVTAWRSCFWHPQLKLYLDVYVDDFKLAGPSANLAAGWKLIRNAIKPDEPHRAGHFLGFKHVPFQRKLPDSGVEVRGIEYDM